MIQVVTANKPCVCVVFVWAHAWDVNSRSSPNSLFKFANCLAAMGNISSSLRHLTAAMWHRVMNMWSKPQPAGITACGRKHSTHSDLHICSGYEEVSGGSVNVSVFMKAKLLLILLMRPHRWSIRHRYSRVLVDRGRESSDWAATNATPHFWTFEDRGDIEGKPRLWMVLICV